MINVQKLQANQKAFSKAQAVKAKVYRRATNFQVAGNGDIYTATPAGNEVDCTCKAAEFGRACYHVAAVFALLQTETGTEAQEDAWIEAAQLAQDGARLQDELQAEAEETAAEIRAEREGEMGFWERLETPEFNAYCDKLEAEQKFWAMLTEEQETAFFAAQVAEHEQYEHGYIRPSFNNYLN